MFLHLGRISLRERGLNTVLAPRSRKVHRCGRCARTGIVKTLTMKKATGSRLCAALASNFLDLWGTVVYVSARSNCPSALRVTVTIWLGFSKKYATIFCFMRCVTFWILGWGLVRKQPARPLTASWFPDHRSRARVTVADDSAVNGNPSVTIILVSENDVHSRCRSNAKTFLRVTGGVPWFGPD